MNILVIMFQNRSKNGQLMPVLITNAEYVSDLQCFNVDFSGLNPWGVVVWGTSHRIHPIWKTFTNEFNHSTVSFQCIV